MSNGPRSEPEREPGRGEEKQKSDGSGIARAVVSIIERLNERASELLKAPPKPENVAYCAYRYFDGAPSADLVPISMKPNFAKHCLEGLELLLEWASNAVKSDDGLARIENLISTHDTLRGLAQRASQLKRQNLGTLSEAFPKVEPLVVISILRELREDAAKPNSLVQSLSHPAGAAETDEEMLRFIVPIEAAQLLGRCAELLLAHRRHGGHGMEALTELHERTMLNGLVVMGETLASQSYAQLKAYVDPPFPIELEAEPLARYKQLVKLQVAQGNELWCTVTLSPDEFARYLPQINSRSDCAARLMEVRLAIASPIGEFGFQAGCSAAGERGEVRVWPAVPTREGGAAYMPVLQRIQSTIRDQCATRVRPDEWRQHGWIFRAETEMRSEELLTITNLVAPALGTSTPPQNISRISLVFLGRANEVLEVSHTLGAKVPELTTGPIQEEGARRFLDEKISFELFRAEEKLPLALGARPYSGEVAKFTALAWGEAYQDWCRSKHRSTCIPRLSS